MEYVHERSDWPGYRWDIGALADLLARVRHRQGLLLGRMDGLGFQARNEAVLDSLTREVVTSSAIEGEKLPQDQVRSSLARRLGIEAGGLVPAARNVESVVDMTLDATQWFAAPLTNERLFSWHAALFPTGFSGLERIQVAAWRTAPMAVLSGPIGREHVHYEAPAADRVEREMARFLGWFEEKALYDPILKAALAHLWFVQIHPFDDGNGRIGRAILDMSLARAEDRAQRFYSLSGQIFKDRTAYYAVLNDMGKGDLEITPWMTWFLNCLDRALARAETVTDAVLEKARFWESLAPVSLNERQRLTLNRLLDGFEGKLTAKKWEAITKVSRPTAVRDIDDLINKKILVADPTGGRSTSYSLVRAGAR